jgi:type IV secretory pathway TrbL component
VKLFTPSSSPRVIVAAKEQIMRRFSSVRHQLHRVFVTALLALAVLALLGKAAHAQACGSIGEQPEAVYDTFLNSLAITFPLGDSAACEKLTKAAISACHKAVSDTASCHTSLTSGVLKGTKPVCSTFKNQSGCLDDAKATADGDKADIASQADSANTVCDTEFAGAIANACNNGLPM